jgi:hypothetical protein
LEDWKIISEYSISDARSLFLRFDCYYAAVDKFHAKCFNVGKNDYGLRMLNTFVNLCERNFDINTITDAIQVNRHALKLNV